MASIKDHYTRASANEGIWCELKFPDGTPHGKLRLLSVDSDSFRHKDIELKRKLFERSLESAKERNGGRLVTDDHRLELMASLIAEWDFDEPCTQENKMTFLREAPQVADFVDRMASQRAAFFKNPLTSLSDSLATSSS